MGIAEDVATVTPVPAGYLRCSCGVIFYNGAPHFCIVRAPTTSPVLSSGNGRSVCERCGRTDGQRDTLTVTVNDTVELWRRTLCESCKAMVQAHLSHALAPRGWAAGV